MNESRRNAAPPWPTDNNWESIVKNHNKVVDASVYSTNAETRNGSESITLVMVCAVAGMPIPINYRLDTERAKKVADHPNWVKKRLAAYRTGVDSKVVRAIKDFADILNVDFQTVIDGLDKALELGRVAGNIDKPTEETRKINNFSNKYIPNFNDFKLAYRTIAKLGQEVSLDAVLDQIEISIKETTHILKENWRIITEENIKKIWSAESRSEKKMTDMQVDWAKRTVKMWGSMENLYDYYEAQGYFFSREILTRYFLSLKIKPFVILTGISGTGKTKIAQIFAEYLCQDETPEEREKRIAFVPVRPDWMDNKGLLGYYNLLAEEYHDTPVLRLLLEAKEHPDKPYFIILDEMNLAKVEQYFSDFLSIMESRTSDKPQGEAIHLHSIKEAKTQDGYPIPSKFHIPPNVYFTGTVNVDESTYMFSPKVLDRANVIEFNEVDLENYEKGIIASDRFALKEQDVRQRLLPVASETPFCSKTDYMGILKTAPETKDHLLKISGILHPDNLHFGYRVVNEISRYIRTASEMVQDFNLEEALDIQILQKILPKFHGTQAKLEEPLWKFLAICQGKGSVPDEFYLEKAAAYDEGASFPRSAKKLARMIQNLKVQGYTSFIE
ncbi:MAG: AAA family ATPase [Thermodesulfobacteriota bacterium]